MRWYLEQGGGVQTLEEFTAFELKRYPSHSSLA
jgi:hypothetical protein